MRMSIIRAVLIPYFVASISGCAATTEANGAEGSARDHGEEATGETSEALNPSCGSPTVYFAGASRITGPIAGIPVTFTVGESFGGWCFNGGDTVFVELIDDTIGQSLGGTSVTAGLDGNSSTWFPGAISGTVYFDYLTNASASQPSSANDHLSLFAIDWMTGRVARSSCFTINNDHPCN
jgi:hypothetical protein